jgi:hypothetical protein
MSLINEALKKAQRARHGSAPADSTPGATGAVERREQPRSAQTTLLIAAGAVVLVVISMVLTALWITRQHQTVPVASATPGVSQPVISEPVAKEPATKPVVVSLPPLSTPPPITVPVVKPPPTPEHKSVATVSTPPAEPPPPAPIPNAASAPASAPTSVAAPVAEADPRQVERIHQFIEAVRVTGIRASGTDSKVLMNDRVYRVNDIVDRTLGLRLTKVGNDSLTFTDPSGATYIKYF